MIALPRFIVRLLPPARPTEPGRTAEELRRQWDDTLAAFRADVRSRLLAEIPFTVEEWTALGDDEAGLALREVYTQEVDRWRNQRLALLSRFLVDGFTTQTMSLGALADELPEQQVDRLLLQRMAMLDKLSPPAGGPVEGRQSTVDGEPSTGSE